MKFFIMTYHNHKGKYDSFHWSYDKACDNFKLKGRQLKNGEKIFLLEIMLYPLKVINTIARIEK